MKPNSTKRYSARILSVLVIVCMLVQLMGPTYAASSDHDAFLENQALAQTVNGLVPEASEVPPASEPPENDGLLPSAEPTAQPEASPSAEPTAEPEPLPSEEPTNAPPLARKARLLLCPAPSLLFSTHCLRLNQRRARCQIMWLGASPSTMLP